MGDSKQEFSVSYYEWEGSESVTMNTQKTGLLDFSLFLRFVARNSLRYQHFRGKNPADFMVNTQKAGKRIHKKRDYIGGFGK